MNYSLLQMRHFLHIFILASQASLLLSNEIVLVPNADGEASVVESVDADFSTDDIFVPTKDWQELKPGQAVPKGLHVRMNLSTGKKEAKILDEKEESIKKIDDDAKEEVKPTKFRSYQDLQDALAEQKMKLNAEFENVETLVKYYGNSTDEERVLILEDLDYYLHQIDNARDFVALGGMNLIIKEALNSHSEILRERAAILFAGAVQSNPEVQERVLSLGWMTNLLDRLTNTSESLSVRSRLVGAISNLIRGSSEALNAFRKVDGFPKYLEILQEFPQSKLRLKILGFLADAAKVTEKGEDSLLASKSLLHGLVSDTVKNLSSEDSLDQIEKVSEILDSFTDYYDIQSDHFDVLYAWTKSADATIEKIRDDDSGFEFNILEKRIEKVRNALISTWRSSDL